MGLDRIVCARLGFVSGCGDVDKDRSREYGSRELGVGIGMVMEKEWG